MAIRRKMRRASIVRRFLGEERVNKKVRYKESTNNREISD